MGIRFKPRIKPFVLVSHQSNVLRPPVSIFDTSSVITADFLLRTLLKQVERIKRLCLKLKHLPKAIKPDTLGNVAGKLASMNKPNLIDYQRLYCPEDIEDTPSVLTCDKDDGSYCDYAI